MYISMYVHTICTSMYFARITVCVPVYYMSDCVKVLYCWPTCLVSTLRGTPNLCFLSEVHTVLYVGIG